VKLCKHSEYRRTCNWCWSC